MNSRVDRNPELETLQDGLTKFRMTPFRLSGSDIELRIRNQILGIDVYESIALCFLGIPGAGKSKLLEKVSKHYEVKPIHVKDLIELNPSIMETGAELYHQGEIIPGIEKGFLELAFAKRQNTYLIDGFPRTLFQALELYRAANERRTRIKLIETRMQIDREVFQSYYRQTQKVLHLIHKGELSKEEAKVDEARIKSKIRRTLELDLYVIETLRALGADVISVDGTPGDSKMYREFKSKMGIK